MCSITTKNEPRQVPASMDHECVLLCIWGTAAVHCRKPCGQPAVRVIAGARVPDLRYCSSFDQQLGGFEPVLLLCHFWGCVDPLPLYLRSTLRYSLVDGVAVPKSRDTNLGSSYTQIARLWNSSTLIDSVRIILQIHCPQFSQDIPSIKTSHQQAREIITTSRYIALCRWLLTPRLSLTPLQSTYTQYAKTRSPHWFIIAKLTSARHVVSCTAGEIVLR